MASFVISPMNFRFVNFVSYKSVLVVVEFRDMYKLPIKHSKLISLILHNINLSFTLRGYQSRIFLNGPWTLKTLRDEIRYALNFKSLEK